MEWSRERPDPLNVRLYGDVRNEIFTGYFALVAGDGPIARTIQRKTGSPYSHMLTLVWLTHKERRILYAVESTHPDSRGVAFSALIERQPEKIDVFHLKPELADKVDFDGLWEWMLRATGQDYPEEILLHDWKVRTGLNPEHEPNSDYPEDRRVCSQLWHAGFRYCGMPPIVEHDCEMYPVWYPDLFEYKFTPIL